MPYPPLACFLEEVARRVFQHGHLWWQTAFADTLRAVVVMTMSTGTFSATDSSRRPCARRDRRPQATRLRYGATSNTPMAPISWLRRLWSTNGYVPPCGMMRSNTTPWPGATR
jgi:hypothetical protein